MMNAKQRRGKSYYRKTMCPKCGKTFLVRGHGRQIEKNGNWYNGAQCPKCGHEFTLQGTVSYVPFLTNGMAADSARKNLACHINNGCNSLKLPKRIKIKACEISQNMRLSKFPRSIAAGCIYVAAMLGGKPRTQRDVADATNITDPSIRAAYREVCKQLSLMSSFRNKIKDIMPKKYNAAKTLSPERKGWKKLAPTRKNRTEIPSIPSSLIRDLGINQNVELEAKWEISNGKMFLKIKETAS